MAATQRYFPTDEGKQGAWMTNFRDKIPTHGPTCGIAATQITDTVADMNFNIWLLGTWHPALQNDVKEGTTYKKLIREGTGGIVPVPVGSTFPSPPAPAVRPPGVLTRLFNLVQRIKLATGYTEVIGQDLGIIGAADTVEHPFSEFNLKVVQGATNQAVRIDFKKFGHEGVHLECRRNNGAWEFIGIDTSSPYLDERPLLVVGAAETREYRLRWYDDGPNGDWSPVQKVAVGA